MRSTYGLSISAQQDQSIRVDITTVGLVLTSSDPDTRVRAYRDLQDRINGSLNLARLERAVTLLTGTRYSEILRYRKRPGS